MNSIPLQRRALLAQAGAAGLALAGVGAAQAADAVADFPTRPMTIIVPFAGGSPPDVYTRLVAEKLSRRVGQPVIVDLKPGASTTIGTTLAARAKPDGYTVLYATNSSITAAPALFRKLQYDPIKDFSAVTVMLESFFCILVRPEDSALSLTALAERIRRDPGANAMGGGSTTAEVSNQMWRNAAKLDHAYVRYNNPNMMNDLWGGRLGAVWAPISSALQHVRAGKAHMVAVTAPARLPQLPQVPTLAETYPGVAVESWSGFFVPSATPRPLVAALYDHIVAVLKDPEIVQRGVNEGVRPLQQTPEQSDAYVRKDLPHQRQLLQGAGIEPA